MLKQNMSGCRSVQEHCAFVKLIQSSSSSQQQPAASSALLIFALVCQYLFSVVLIVYRSYHYMILGLLYSINMSQLHGSKQRSSFKSISSFSQEKTKKKFVLLIILALAKWVASLDSHRNSSVVKIIANGRRLKIGLRSRHTTDSAGRFVILVLPYISGTQYLV